MGSKTRNVIIQAYKDESAEHGVRFEMTDCGAKQPAPERLRFSKDDDKMDKNDHHKVVFELRREAGLNIEFVSSRADVLWVHEVAESDEDKCPTSRCEHDEFAVMKAVDPLELTVRNKNSREALLGFTINFIRSGMTETPVNFIPFDPIVVNRDGGTRSSGITSSTLRSLAPVAAVVTTVVVGVAVFFGLRKADRNKDKAPIRGR